MITKDTPEKLKPYIFHGVDIDPISKSEAHGSCPFCQSDKFFVSLETGQFNCKSCNESGNTMNFLNTLHSESLRDTTEEDYKDLSKKRGIPVSELKAWKVALSPFGDWLIPAYNGKRYDKGPKKNQPVLANLYKATERDDGKFVVMGTPGRKIHPFGRQFKSGNKNRKTTLIVLEGPWDGMALRYVLSQLKLRTGGYDITPEGLAQNISPKKDGKHSLLDGIDVMAVPGSGTFSDEWLDEIDEYDHVYLLFDNDHPRTVCPDCKKRRRVSKKPCPHCDSEKLGKKRYHAGYDGMTRIVKMVADEGIETNLYALHWSGSLGKECDRNLPDGYDVRDHINTLRKRDKQTYLTESMGQLLTKLIKMAQHGAATSSKEDEEEVQEIEPIPCSSFKQLCKEFEGQLHFTPPTRDTFAVMLATVISTSLEGDQLWVRVIGPPGSGKSTLAECISASKRHVLATSVFTGFHSGFTGGRRGKGKDASLIPLLDDMCFVVKDADTMTSSNRLDQILGELRDIYDGTSRNRYRNRVANSYEDIRTTVLLCGTDELRGLNRAFLGDRFLDCEILDANTDTTPFIDRAADNTYAKVVRSLKEHRSGRPEKSELPPDRLKAITLGFINHMKENLGQLIPAYPAESKRTIKSIARYLAAMRARVRRDNGELLYRSRKELGTRLTAQLTKMAMSLAIVLGRKEIDKEVVRICKKLVLNTATGFPQEITHALYKKKEGLSSKQLHYTLKLSESTIRRHLHNMLELHVVQRGSRPNNSGVRGRDLDCWTLTKEVRNDAMSIQGKL